MILPHAFLEQTGLYVSYFFTGYFLWSIQQIPYDAKDLNCQYYQEERETTFLIAVFFNLFSWSFSLVLFSKYNLLESYEAALTIILTSLCILQWLQIEHRKICYKRGKSLLKLSQKYHVNADNLKNIEALLLQNNITAFPLRSFEQSLGVRADQKQVSREVLEKVQPHLEIFYQLFEQKRQNDKTIATYRKDAVEWTPEL